MSAGGTNPARRAAVITRYGELDYGRGRSRRLLSPKTLVRISFLVAVSFLLMTFVEFPIPPFPAFLKYDPAEIPVLIGTFALGPIAGVLIQLGKCLLYFFLSGKAEPVGTTANFTVGAVWAFTAGLLYRRWHSRLGALISMAAGAAVMTAVMVPMNYFVFFPAYGVPKEAAMAMMFGTTVPFNLVKAVISGGLTFLLYKRVRRWL